MSLISIVIPTVTGREHWLQKCVASCERTVPNLELIVVSGKSSCGEAWQGGVMQASGDYVLFCADDIELHDNWLQAACQVVDNGFVPAPVIYNTDGSLQSCGGSWERMEPDGNKTDFSRVPFASKELIAQIGPIPPLHYYSDNWFTAKARRLGFDPVVCYGFSITHHLAPEQRLDERLSPDGAEYNRLVEEWST